MMTAERLKGSLLQMAMQGKLVEQRSEEGTGNELLRGVKGSETIESDTQENLIEIPDNWCWAQLGVFCELYTGNSISESVKKAKYMKDIEGYPYIATKDVRFDNSVDYSNGVIIPYEEEFRHAYNGSVLMCIEGGSAGRKIAIIDRDVCFGNKLCMFNSSIAYNRFMYYFLQSPMFKNGFKDGITGIIGGVSIKKLKKMWMPLPPLEEQKRIVAKIDELMPFVEQYAEASTKLNTLNTSFPDMMKKSILQEAVQGKLVPQVPNDEPASELLKRIAEEKKRLIKEGKIKKQKALPEITEDEIPFDIPESWEWVRLCDLFHSIEAGKSKKCHEVPPDNGQAGIIKVSAVTWGEFQENESKTCIAESDWNSEYQINPNDFLITRANTKQLVGACVIVETITKRLMLSDKTLRIVFSGHISHKFLLYVLRSAYLRSQIEERATGTSDSMKNISQKAIAELVVALPPIIEQERIVEELDRVLPELNTTKEDIDFEA